jgi:hypothetical protein
MLGALKPQAAMPAHTHQPLEQKTRFVSFMKLFGTLGLCLWKQDWTQDHRSHKHWMQFGSFCTHPQGVRQTGTRQAYFLILESINDGSWEYAVTWSHKRLFQNTECYLFLGIQAILGEWMKTVYSILRARFFGFSNAVSWFSESPLPRKLGVDGAMQSCMRARSHYQRESMRGALFLWHEVTWPNFLYLVGLSASLHSTSYIIFTTEPKHTHLI